MKHVSKITLFVIGFVAFLILVGENDALSLSAILAIKALAAVVLFVCAAVGVSLTPSRSDDEIA